MDEKLSEKITNISGTKREDSRITLMYFSVAFITILIGGILGLAQGLNRVGFLDLPAAFNYYHVLTDHGILLVLVFSLLFVIVYFYSVLSHTMDGLYSVVRKMGWLAFFTMLVGVVFVMTPVVMGDASVMYTFLSTNESFSMVLCWLIHYDFRCLDSSSRWAYPNY